MNFFRKHGKLLSIVLLAIVCALWLLHGSIEETILALVPRSIRQQVELFQHSPLSQKLIVVTKAADAEQAISAAQLARENLFQDGWIRPWNTANQNVLSSFLDALPGRFTPQDQEILTAKVSRDGIAEQLERYQEQLFSLEGMFAKQLLVRDPFYLTELLFNKWERLGQTTRTEYQDGFLATPDGTLQAGLYDLKEDIAQFSTAEQLHQWFMQFEQTLPEGVRIFFMGALRYTFENVSVIKHDLLFLSLVGLALLSAVFFVFFRTKRALLIYALPLVVLPPAALVSQLIFGRLSGITLGFGSVVAGLSVDYAIYVYFALQSSAEKKPQTRSQIRRHLWCNFLTSALCFVALLFSSVEVFKQIAVFALVALSLALWIALCIFPAYFMSEGVSIIPMKKIPYLQPLSFKNACWTSLGLLLFGVWGAFHISFNDSLESLNSTTKTFQQDKQDLNRLFATDEQALLFALGGTEEEAINNNAQLSAHLPVSLAVNEIIVSPTQQRENQKRWNSFWQKDRIDNAKALLEKESQKRGFQSSSFTPFWQWLEASFSLHFIDLSAWYNPVLTLRDGSYAVVNVVPDTASYKQLAQLPKVVFVSASQLQKELTSGVKKEAVWVVGLALLFNGIAVWVVFKRFKAVLFSFIPVLLGSCILFGCLSLFKVQVNLFGLIFLPLLVGLGIDYAIFQLMKQRAGQENLAELYPPQALLAAALSTLAGFGVLVLAHHAVLFIMGLCALLGIGGAVLAALFILPSLWEHYA